VKLRPRTDQHDLDFKLKNARRFLVDGDKVKVTVMYRGREMVHREFGYRQLTHVTELLSDIANVENPPRMEGRFLSMILVPNREAIAEVRRLHASGKADGEDGPDAAAETEPPVAGDLGDAEATPPMADAPGDAEAAKDANNN
jgi:translation initiation factor IF-3